MIGRAQLEGGQPDVVVAVDEAGQDDVIGRAQPVHARVVAGQLAGRPDLDDDAIPLEDRAVRDDHGAS
jgi:hypothetical protein